MPTYFPIFAAVTYSVLAVAAFVFGADRGIRVKKLNANVIHFFIWIMTLWYYLAIWNDFEYPGVTRDDGVFDIPLLHFISSTTIMLVFTVLISYRIKQDTLNILFYAFVCVFINLCLFLSVVLFKESSRTGWTAAAIVFTAFLIIHTIKDSNQENIGSQKFIKAVVVLVSLYVIAYLCLTRIGPLHQDLITFTTQETLLVCADLAISLLCAIPITHYGWAISHEIQRETRPGVLSAMARVIVNANPNMGYCTSMSSRTVMSNKAPDALTAFIDSIHTF